MRAEDLEWKEAPQEETIKKQGAGGLRGHSGSQVHAGLSLRICAYPDWTGQGGDGIGKTRGNSLWSRLKEDAIKDNK